MPCSIDRTPARTAFLIPDVACACDITSSPTARASATMASISSTSKPGWSGLSRGESTPPEVAILITSAPACTSCRTLRIHLFPDYPGSPGSIVDGPDQMRRKVRQLVQAGADVIKIATSGGVLSPRDKPDQPGFDVEEIEAMVAKAHAVGLEVMSHAQATSGIKNAVRAGVRSIEHGIYLDDEAIQLMLDRGAYLVATLVAARGVVDAAEAGASIPAASLAKAIEVLTAHRESFRAAYEAGVKIAMG